MGRRTRTRDRARLRLGKPPPARWPGLGLRTAGGAPTLCEPLVFNGNNFSPSPKRIFGLYGAADLSAMARMGAAGSTALKGEDAADLDQSKDSLALLREHIAKSPEDFFASANVAHNGLLTLEEWEAACARALAVFGREAPELAREMFGQLDQNKDGAVSREEFLDMRSAIRLFLKGANTQELIVEMFVGAVTAHLAKTSQPHDDDTSVADKTLGALMSLEMAEIHEAVTPLSKVLHEHTEQVRREHQKRDKAQAQFQHDKAEGKFCLPAAAFGSKAEFHKGLEVRGANTPASSPSVTHAAHAPAHSRMMHTNTHARAHTHKHAHTRAHTNAPTGQPS